jgi:hypothetical protein
VANELWQDPDNRHDIAEMMLGHRIDSRVLQQDRELAGIIGVLRDPDEAFGTLLLYRSMEAMVS